MLGGGGGETSVVGIVGRRWKREGGAKGTNLLDKIGIKNKLFGSHKKELKILHSFFNFLQKLKTGEIKVFGLKILPPEERSFLVAVLAAAV